MINNELFEVNNVFLAITGEAGDPRKPETPAKPETHSTAPSGTLERGERSGGGESRKRWRPRRRSEGTRAPTAANKRAQR